MLNFSDYQRLRQNGVTTNGSVHTVESKNVIEATWYDDPASTIAYFYDYYHDDEPNLNVGLHPEESKTKIPIDIKYIQSNYQTLAKDIVDYKIMFKPSHVCDVPYYKEKFEDVVKSTYPVGLYLDIMDTNGVWNKWLVVGNANVNNRDFPNWSILPCGYNYQWVYKGKKMSMWGVERSQNSYNSGVWADYKFETTENQTKFILPYNDISKTIYYNLRMCVSVDLPEPITWRISKVEGLVNKGTINFTLYQDLWNPHTDVIERDDDGKLIGLWADLKGDGNLPITEPDDPEILPIETDGNYAEMTYTGAKPQVKINGGYKTVTIQYYNSGELIKDQEPGVWSYLIDDTDVSEMVTVLATETPNTIKIKFNGDETYMHKVLTVRNTRSDATAEIKFELISL